MNKKILVTGVHGFIGNNLVDALRIQHIFYGLDIIKKEKQGVEMSYAWDDLQNVPFVNTIIHLAGKAHDVKNSSDPQSYFDINVGLTKRIFDYFLQSSAEKFIFFSSVKAVADRVEGAFLTETATPAPLTPYGQSKLEAERYILSQPLPPGKKIYILRPCMIHGSGNKGNLNLLYNLAKWGLPWPLGAFHNQRSFTSVDNLTFIVQQLIEREIVPGIYQVGDDEAVSTNKLIQLIAATLGRRAAIWNIPQAPIRLLAKAGDLLHLPLNSERLKKLTESYVVSNSKLKEALGIEKMPVSAEEGLRKTLGAFET